MHDSIDSLDVYGSENFVVNEEEQGKDLPGRIFIKEKRIRLNRKNFNEIITVINLEEHEDISEEDRVCTICFEEYSKEKVYRITPCKHIFHHKCIYEWIITNRKKRCPNDNYRFR